MKINANMPRENALEAVVWAEGMEVPPGELVRVKGYTYMNLQKQGLNDKNPVEHGSNYSKALKGHALIKMLAEWED